MAFLFENSKINPVEPGHVYCYAEDNETVCSFDGKAVLMGEAPFRVIGVNKAGVWAQPYGYYSGEADKKGYVGYATHSAGEPRLSLRQRISEIKEHIRAIEEMLWSEEDDAQNKN